MELSKEDQKAMEEGYYKMIEWEEEVFEHNKSILNSIDHNKNDFESLLDFADVTDKIEWVEEPKFKPKNHPEKHGVFYLTHIEQWQTGMEGDSYSGYMYVKVNNENKWLKIPYSC